MNEDKSTRYHRLQRRAAVLGAVWWAVLLTLLGLSGLSQMLRDAAESIAAGIAPGAASATAAGLYTLALLLVHEVVALPLAFYGGFLIERRYGLSEQPLHDWLRDQAKSLLLGGTLAVAAAAMLYAIVRSSGAAWWLVASALFSLTAAGLAVLGPVIFLPMFYPVKKLDDEALTARLLALCERAGTRVAGIYEWRVALKTRKANAALAGFGATRRILVSDTMLADYSPDEIEVVLAHELAHHLNGDMWKALLGHAAVTTFGFAAAAAAVQRAGVALDVRGPADIAGLPVVLLAYGAVSLVARPVLLALSREAERRADLFALSATRNPAAFISAMRRLAAQNLAEAHPSRLVQWFFYSHPPISERVAAARSYQAPPAGRVIAAV